MKCNLLLVAYSLLFSLSAHAAKVTSLKVEGNIVIFTESGTKTAAVPACASANPTKWGLSLLTDSDRATYSVLVAAMASNMDVNIISAQQCVDGADIEKVKAVEVLPQPVVQVQQGLQIVAVGFSSSSGAAVYKTLYASNGKPYMTTYGSGAYQKVQCDQSSVPFSNSSGSQGYMICLK